MREPSLAIVDGASDSKVYLHCRERNVNTFLGSRISNKFYEVLAKLSFLQERLR